jgi:hypothetical protein
MRIPSFIPIEKAVLHVVVVAGAADFLAAGLTPHGDRAVVTFRVQVLCSGAGIYSAVITRGGVAVVGTVLGGAAIAANDWVQFDVFAHAGDTVNFRHSVGGNVTLRVREIWGGVE